MYRFYVNIVFISLGKYLTVGLLGHVITMFNILRNYTSLHSDQQSMRIPSGLLPDQYLKLSVFLKTLANLINL